MAGAARVAPARLRVASAPASSRLRSGFALATAIEASRSLDRYCGLQERIAVGVVDWDALEGLVALMIETAPTLVRVDSASKMRARLDRTWQREYKRLATSARRIGAGSVPFEKRTSP